MGVNGKPVLALLVAWGWMLAMTARAQTVLQFVEGIDPGDRFGWSVSGLGDVNADGLRDVVVGTYHDQDAWGVDTGSATVYSGADGTVIHKVFADGPALLGMSVSGAGDVNGDSVPDFIAGIPTVGGDVPGAARVYSGVDASLLLQFDGDTGGDRFGHSVSGAGDVNGDGRDDVIVGAPWAVPNGPNSGLARVYSGIDGSVLHDWPGDALENRFGWSVRGAGDVNGDGLPDLIVGASTDDNGGSYSGSATVFSGADGSVLHVFEGAAPLDWFGYAVSGAGDVNGDGRDDLIVGAWGEDSAGTDAGSARVYSGADGALLYAFTGSAADDRFGWSVSAAGDIDRDGFADVLVGALLADGNGVDSGSAFVHSGADGTLLFAVHGAGPGRAFGRSVSAAGDTDGDCIADIVIGAYSDDEVLLGSATVVSGLAAGWSGLGGALAGTNGVPCLSATGTLQAGAPVTLRLEDALEASTAFVLVGLSALYAPFKGGVLVPDFTPPGFFIALPTGPAGALLIQDNWPAGVPSGFTVYFQDWIVDPAAVQGFAASQGLAASTP